MYSEAARQIAGRTSMTTAVGLAAGLAVRLAAVGWAGTISAGNYSYDVESTPTIPSQREDIEAKYTELIKKCIDAIEDMKLTLEECQEKLKSMKEIVRDKISSK